MMPSIGSCLFVPSIYVSPETTCLNYTRGPWVTRRPSNQGSKKGRYPLWLRGKKFRSRIRFLQLSTGKVTPYGHVLYQFGETSYSIVFYWCLFVLSGTNLGITSRLRTSAHPNPLNRSLVWDGGPGPMQATAYTALLITKMTHFLSQVDQECNTFITAILTCFVNSVLIHISS